MATGFCAAVTTPRPDATHHGPCLIMANRLRQYVQADSIPTEKPKSIWHSPFYRNMHPMMLLYRRRAVPVDPILTLPSRRVDSAPPTYDFAASTNGGSSSQPITLDEDDEQAYEDACHSCTQGGELLMCDNDGCIFAFCFGCTSFVAAQSGYWTCPAY